MRCGSDRARFIPVVVERIVDLEIIMLVVLSDVSKHMSYISQVSLVFKLPWFDCPTTLLIKQPINANQADAEK